MLGKGMIMFVLMILAIVGYLLFQHYKHAWGYDDDTVIHHYSLRLDVAPRTVPRASVRVSLAA